MDIRTHHREPHRPGRRNAPGLPRSPRLAREGKTPRCSSARTEALTTGHGAKAGNPYCLTASPLHLTASLTAKLAAGRFEQRSRPRGSHLNERNTHEPLPGRVLNRSTLNPLAPSRRECCNAKNSEVSPARRAGVIPDDRTVAKGVTSQRGELAIAFLISARPVAASRLLAETG
jgi:hypothetical protein